MRVAGLDAIPSTKVFGVVVAGRTLAQIPVEVPVNLLTGAHDGPVLAVTGGVHGAELIGTFAILEVMRDLDLSRLRGAVIAVPVANTSGFEFGTRHVYWDGKILNRVGGGRSNGTYTERLAHLLYHEIVAQADAWIDIHSGTPETYMWYTIAKGGPPGTAPALRALEMAQAFGLVDIAIETPWTDASLDLGIPAITPEIGGGPDFLRGGQVQVETCARGIRNVMRLLGMVDGSIEAAPERFRLWKIHTDITNGPVGGILTMTARRGDHLESGQTFGVIRHPFNGEELARIASPARGTVVDSGVVWPVVRPGQWLGALGDVVDEIAARWEL
jgi:predicted deacylase